MLPAQLPDPRFTVCLSLPNTNPSRVPIISAIESAFRCAAPPAAGMDPIEFNQALKRLEKAMATSKGHIYKRTPDIQEFEDWTAAVDELLLEADLIQEERLTDVQRLRVIALFARTCLDRDDKLVIEWRRVVKYGVTTVKEIKRTFGENFLGWDPMKGL